MLLLTSTSDIIRVITGTTGSDIEVHASWVDNNAGAITPGRTNTASIVTNTTTTVVAAPASGVQRNVKHLSLSNNHASTATSVAVEHYDGTNAVELREVNLLAGENLTLDLNGNWRHYDANGGEYVGIGPMATQAEMEGGSSVTTVVSPGRQHYHPSACKFWCNVTGAGTPAMQANYNVTSIGDTGTGRMTVTIGTDFSSGNWCCCVSIFQSQTTGDEMIPNIDAKAAGTVEAGARIGTASPAFTDPVVGYDVCGFGDQ